MCLARHYKLRSYFHLAVAKLLKLNFTRTQNVYIAFCWVFTFTFVAWLFVKLPRLKANVRLERDVMLCDVAPMPTH